MTTTHRIEFPSVHGTFGKLFAAEVSAPSYALAVRDVLEHVASEGITLGHVQIANLPDLEGVKLDGLKLDSCRVSNVNLCGASLKGVRIEHCAFAKVVADSSTHFDGAMLDDVTFEDCAINGASFKGASLAGLRFEFTEARALDLENASINGLRSVRSNLSGWKAHLCRLRFVEAVDALIESMDLTTNQKSAVRLLAINDSREAAVKFLADLDAKTV